MTKMEAQYFKLIGVTLLMTAACVSDSGTKKSLYFSECDVREIILEQFHLLSSNQFNQVVDWENAIREISELSTAYRVPALHVKLDVVTSNQALPDFQETAKGYPGRMAHERQLILSHGSYPEVPVPVLSSPNKFSLAVRAGPRA
jgi:hypothetical protein